MLQVQALQTPQGMWDHHVQRLPKNIIILPRNTLLCLMQFVWKWVVRARWPSTNCLQCC